VEILKNPAGKPSPTGSTGTIPPSTEQQQTGGSAAGGRPATQNNQELNATGINANTAQARNLVLADDDIASVVADNNPALLEEMLLGDNGFAADFAGAYPRLLQDLLIADQSFASDFAGQYPNLSAEILENPIISRQILEDEDLSRELALSDRDVAESLLEANPVLLSDADFTEDLLSLYPDLVEDVLSAYPDILNDLVSNTPDFGSILTDSIPSLIGGVDAILGDGTEGSGFTEASEPGNVDGLGDSCGKNTLGGMICNVIASSSTLPGLFTGLSYMMGLILGFMGILKLKEHVEMPNQVQIWDPLKRFIAGGAFFALPMVFDVLYNTVAYGIDAYTGTSFNSQGASGGGLDAMMVALIGDIWKPMEGLFYGFCYLAAIILVMIGISRLLKTEQEGPRGPTGIGTIMTFLVAGVLFSIDKIMGATQYSIFAPVTGGIGYNYAELAYTGGMSPEEVAHANAVIAAIIAFVAIIGWVSFIRGFFIIRSVSEGSSQASMMAGMTHILGGALAVNLGGVLAAVQATLGIDDMGLGICFASGCATPAAPPAGP